MQGFNNEMDKEDILLTFPKTTFLQKKTNDKRDITVR
jgi:hypothetical protein